MDLVIDEISIFLSFNFAALLIFKVSIAVIFIYLIVAIITRWLFAVPLQKMKQN